MTTSPTQNHLAARLLTLLSRWSLATALMILVTMFLYMGVGFSATDSALGPEYAELMPAVRSPVLYRLQTLSEGLYWLLIGGTLIIFAGTFTRRAPIRAGFMAACGIGQLTGALGSFMRAHAISDIAARYAIAAPNQQAALLQSLLDLDRVIEPHYTLSTLCLGAGFLLVAGVAWKWSGFPRWLAVWLGIGGVLGLVLFGLRAAGSLSALVLPAILVDVMVLLVQYVALAIALWRPSSHLAAEAASASAATQILVK